MVSWEYRSPFKKGDLVIAFDADEWAKTVDIQDNSIFFKLATVISIRYWNIGIRQYKGEWLADIQFENGKRSNSHFQSGLKHALK
jgi:hypothetical protein